MLKHCSCVSSTLAPCKSHIVKLLQHLIYLNVSAGKRMTPTWTRLSTTAAAGSSSITLNEAVNWPVGAKIVIPTTSDRHSQRENEMATIASVSNGGMTLNLEQPLEYEHVCVSEVCIAAHGYYCTGAAFLAARACVRERVQLRPTCVTLRMHYCWS